MADLGPILQAATERVHYAEGRRTQYVAIAAGLFAGAIALVSLGGQGTLERFKYAVLTAAGGFFLLSLVLFVLFSLQTNRYPWTSATKTWKWFYRDALADQSKFDASFRVWLLRWSKEIGRARNEFDKQLKDFGVSIQRVRDPKESLWQDIQQLYVLHVNEKYKNKYLTTLRSTFNIGLTATLIGCLIAQLVQLAVRSDHQVDLEFVDASAIVHLIARRADLDKCESKCWLVSLSAHRTITTATQVTLGLQGTDCAVLPGAPLPKLELVRQAQDSESAYLSCDDSQPEALTVAVTHGE